MKIRPNRKSTTANAASPFHRTARRLLDEADRVDVNIVVRSRASRSAAARLRSIVVDAGVLELSDHYQTWLAAHETAHIALGHRHASPRILVRAVAISGLALCWGASLILLEVIGKSAALATLVIGLFVALMVLLGTTFYAAAGETRQDERAADDQAGDWGYPVTSAVAAQLVEIEAEPAKSRAWLALRSHDLPAQRLSRAQERTTS